MREEQDKFFKAWLIVFASLCYAYYIPSLFRQRILRFLSVLPIFYIFTIIPLYLTRPVPVAILSFFLTFLGNFKLLLYSFNIGPLATQNSLILFIILGAFPFTLREKNSPNYIRPPKKLKLYKWEKIVICILLAYIYDHTKNKIVANFLFYILVDISFWISTILVLPLGIKLEPLSNEPYVASSLQDFWGKRWNRIVNFILRDSVYFPVRSFFLNHLGQKWAQTMGILATFIVSGLMHEVIYYHVIRAKPTWEVTWFFVLQGVGVVVEVAIKRELGWNLNLHWAISGPLVMTFVISMANLLFFPPLIRNHIDDMIMEDAKALGKSLIGI